MTYQGDSRKEHNIKFGIFFFVLSAKNACHSYTPTAEPPEDKGTGNIKMMSDEQKRVLFLFFYTLYYPFRENLVRLQQPQEQRNPVLQVHAGSFVTELLTWTTCAYMIILLRACTHRGWAHRQ